MFFFFLKNLSEVSTVVFPLVLYVWYGASIVSMLGKLSYSFPSLDQPPAFYLLHLQGCEISLRVPLTWRDLFFLPVSFPAGHIHLFVPVIFSFMSQSLFSPSFSDSTVRVSRMGAVPAFPWLAIFPINLLTFDLNFTSNVITLFLYRTFICGSQWSIHFCKTSHVFITGSK